MDEEPEWVGDIIEGLMTLNDKLERVLQLLEDDEEEEEEDA